MANKYRFRAYTSLVACAVLVMYSSTANADLIGINVSIPAASSQLLPGESAGYVPQVNWNNIQIGTTSSGIVDDSDSGTALSVTVGGSAWQTNTDTSSPDQKLYNFQNWAGSPEYLIQNIPYATYDLYFYPLDIGSPGKQSSAHVTAGTFDQTYYYHTEALFFADTGYVVTTNTIDNPNDPFANVVKITGLTSSSVVINSEDGMVGFQIISSVPEPSSVVLLLLGAAGFIPSRRRRNS